MPFLGGRVSYNLLRTTGSVESIDSFLEKLKEHSFVESPAPRAGVLESGFTTGVHMLDHAYTYDKNIFGSVAHFALRIDSHQIPGDMKKALRIKHEQWAAKASGSGFASKADKADAKEEAENVLTEQLASGKFRKSKMVPILWDFKASTIYCGCSSDTAIGELARLMREAFGVKIQPLSAGVLAAEYASVHRLVQFDDLRPSPFTAPPAEVDQGDDPEKPKVDHSIPGVPWIAKARDLRDFLGNEFLLWMIIKSSAGIHTYPPSGIGDVAVTPWKALDMDCAWGCTGKTAIRATGEEGSPLRAPAFAKALKNGQWPRKMTFLLANDENGFELSLQGDQMAVSGCRLPDVDKADTERTLQTERIRAILNLSATIQATYDAFLHCRISPEWNRELQEIQMMIDLLK